jgi:hypothetical protein
VAHVDGAIGIGQGAGNQDLALLFVGLSIHLLLFTQRARDRVLTGLWG